MGLIILGVLGVILIFGVAIFIVLKLLKPQQTGSVKSIEASMKEGIKFRFYSPQPYLDGIPKLPPDNPIRKGFDDAILAMGKYKYDDAIGIFRKLLLLPEAEDSHKGPLLNHIGLCFHRQGNSDKALGSYKESLELAEKIQDKEGRVVNLNNIGMVYTEKGDYPHAIRDYTKAIEIDPNYALAFNNRGAAYYTKKDYDTAIRDFNEAIELDPKLAMAFYNRGNAYVDKKDYDYDAAICDYRRAIELDPNHAKSMSNMGDTYKLKGDKDKAKEWYRKALEKKEYLPSGAEEIVKQRLKNLEE